MVDNIVTRDVLAAFCRYPARCTVMALGSGNINDTYLVQSVSQTFVLQRINGEVFPEPLRVIENFQKVSDHLTRKKKRARRQLQVAEPVLTRENCLFYVDPAGSFWRAQTFIPHKSYRVLTRHEQARNIGQVLATFHRRIADLDLHGFLNPLPGFHHLPSYLKEYDREAQNRQLGADANEELCFCIAAVERYRQQASTLETAKDAGILTLQPIHGDPKVDNFIFNHQGEGVGLLDLDTVAMGLAHYDLGDCLRSCCNRAGETGKGELPVSFDMTFCRAFFEGYFSGPAPLLTEQQCGYVFDGVLLICFELGLRFLTDHLRGNLYFKVQQDGDNLVRAIKQFRLADDIAKQEQEIRALVLTFSGHS